LRGSSGPSTYGGHHPERGVESMGIVYIGFVVILIAAIVVFFARRR
jgi:hypothetical protein